MVREPTKKEMRKEVKENWSNKFVFKGEPKQSSTNQQKTKKNNVNHKKISQKSHWIDFDRRPQQKLYVVIH